MFQSSQHANPNSRALRSIAILECAKGMAVLLVGLGLLSLSHHDIDIEDIAQHLLYVLHLNPDHHLSQVFLAAAGRFHDLNLMVLAFAAALYSILRFAEAYGLWNGRVWAQWLALISGAVYLPLEIYELIRRHRIETWVLFLVNVVIVLYMGYLRLRPGQIPWGCKHSSEKLRSDEPDLR